MNPKLVFNKKLKPEITDPRTALIQQSLNKSKLDYANLNPVQESKIPGVSTAFINQKLQKPQTQTTQEAIPQINKEQGQEGQQLMDTTKPEERPALLDKLMKSSQEVAKFMSTPQGYRSMAMFMPPDSAMEMIKKADNMDATNFAQSQLREQAIKEDNAKKMEAVKAGLAPSATLKLSNEELQILAPGIKSKPENILLADIGGRKKLIDKTDGTVIKDLGVDVTGKQAQQSASGLASVKQMRGLLDPYMKDKISWENFQKPILKSKMGLLATPEGRKIRGSLYNSVDIILRDRTGAVINPDEFDKAMDAWGLKLGDTPEVVKKKLNDLELTLKLMGGQIDSGTPEGEKAIKALSELESAVKPYSVSPDQADKQLEAKAMNQANSVLKNPNATKQQIKDAKEVLGIK
jgi:hypothetical protein